MGNIIACCQARPVNVQASDYTGSQSTSTAADELPNERFIFLDELLAEPAHFSPDPKNIEERINEYQQEEAAIQTKRSKLSERLKYS